MKEGLYIPDIDITMESAGYPVTFAKKGISVHVYEGKYGNYLKAQGYTLRLNSELIKHFKPLVKKKSFTAARYAVYDESETLVCEGPAEICAFYMEIGMSRFYAHVCHNEHDRNVATRKGLKAYRIKE